VRPLPVVILILIIVPWIPVESSFIWVIIDTMRVDFLLIKVPISTTELPVEVTPWNLSISSKFFMGVMVEHQVFNCINVHKNSKGVVVQCRPWPGDVNLCISSQISLMLRKGQENHLRNSRRVLADCPTLKTLKSICRSVSSST
jgi:hypothetical protein